MIRVLIADDQAMVRSALAMLLTGEDGIEVVGEAADGAEAVARVAELRPTVVVMDVRMPGTDGVEATRQITSDAFPGEARVLVLTTYNVSEAVYQALRAGASGFLLKDAAPGELVSAVRALAEGDGWLDPAVVADMLAEFAARPERIRPAPAGWRRSPAGSARSSSWWRTASPTRRSRPTCSSARRRSRPTSGGSS